MKFTYTFPTRFWDAAANCLSESLRALSFRISHNTEGKVNLDASVFTILKDDFQGVQVNLAFVVKDSLAPKEIKAILEEIIYLEKNLEKDVERSDKKANQLHEKYFKVA